MKARIAALAVVLAVVGGVFYNAARQPEQNVSLAKSEEVMKRCCGGDPSCPTKVCPKK